MILCSTFVICFHMELQKWMWMDTNVCYHMLNFCLSFTIPVVIWTFLILQCLCTKKINKKIEVLHQNHTTVNSKSLCAPSVALLILWINKKKIWVLFYVFFQCQNIFLECYSIHLLSAHLRSQMWRQCECNVDHLHSNHGKNGLNFVRSKITSFVVADRHHHRVSQFAADRSQL